ncbi:hypothetical protein WJX82_005490 [Trebouxia sp. C0006]
MGNCCCKSGAAGAIAATQSDRGEGGNPSSGIGKGTGRSTLNGGSGVGNGKQGASAGGAGGLGPTDPNYGAVESTSSVKVAVVVRPLIDLEKAKKAKECVQVEPPNKIKLPPLQLGSTNTEAYNFDYDRAYKLDSKEESRRLFAELVQPLLDRYLQGFNVTVFAYGQTGSGKTYTMGTAASVKEVSGKGESTGIIPRSIKSIFAAMQQSRADYDVTMKVDFVEVYQDQVRDLLINPNEDGTTRMPVIDIRESPSQGIFLEGVREVEVKTETDIAQLLEAGNGHRAVAAHNLNDASSRSHAIFTLTLEQRRKPTAPPDSKAPKFLKSKLHLVDLAGSERADDTGATGKQLAEGININKGLLALGNVISALTDRKGRRHIPYRDSKLTRILQDSLGGNSETLMVACVSPAQYNQEQTLSTLRYASRARSIQNSLRLNSKMSAEEEVLYLRKVLIERENEIALLKEQLGAGATKGNNNIRVTAVAPPSKAW